MWVNIFGDVCVSLLWVNVMYVRGNRGPWVSFLRFVVSGGGLGLGLGLGFVC